MTLSRFLRDYVYIALGGNRFGPLRRHTNLMLTMLLGGLWHGANWTFVAWGFLHGAFLVINHGWRHVPGARHAALAAHPAYRVAAWALTFLCVVIAWVFFRAQSFADAANILSGMAALQGTPALPGWLPGAAAVPAGLPFAGLAAVDYWANLLLIGLGLVIVWCGRRMATLSTTARLLLLVPCFGLVVQSVFFGSKTAQFIYFQF